ncbi:MAG: hypothetical protein NZ522_02295, partial [Chitinophagales bacterium]|nr:hypothetical protein [Chitinophagales bacterium]
MIVFRYIAFLLITFPLSVNSCDICGCSMGTSAALLPQLNNSVLGLRYNTSFFTSIHPSHGTADAPIKKSRDEFHSIELVGRYNLSPRFHLTALLPYKISSQQEGET